MLAKAPASVYGLALTLCFTAIGCGSGESHHAGNIKTIEPGVLQVCLYPGFPPFVEQNADSGAWDGWDVKYLQGFAAQQQLTFKAVKIMEFKDIWTLPGEKNRCDIAASGISDLPERRRQTGTSGTWSKTYYYVVRAFAVRTADADKLGNVQDLDQKTVIVTEDSTADHDLRNRLSQAGMTSVTIEYTTNEEEAARQVRDAQEGSGPFAYGGGYGSIAYLADREENRGKLKLVWPHCNMTKVGDEYQEVTEPFSFVVRQASTGIAAALDAYIAANTYPGTLPDLKCPSTPPAN